MTAPDHRRIRSKDLLHRRGHPHMTHWSVLATPESPSESSRGLNRFHGQKNGPSGDVYFSNRPIGVKRFQTIHQHSVDVAHGLALLFGISRWTICHPT